MFRDILWDKYVQTRLSKVIKLILEKCPDYLLEDEHYESNVFQRERKAKFMTCLKIRQVSKQCKTTLESISIDLDLRSYLTLKTTEQVQGIVATLMDNPSYATSFFPNDIFINENDVRKRNDFQQFHEEILVFLKLVGHRIYRFNYMSFLELQADVFNCIRIWTAFMPNLRHFKAGQGYLQIPDQIVPSLPEIQALPVLPLLQSYENGNLYTPFIQRILETSPNIEDLRLDQCYNPSEHSPHALETALNLTSFRIHIYPALLQYRDFQWKLLNKLVFRSQEMMYIQGEPSRDPNDTVSTSTIFPFLKQFDGTLEHLDFGRIYIIYNGGYLELRNLKTLKLELHDESFENLNFLLYAEKLETLLVKIGRTCMKGLPPSGKFNRILKESFLGKSVWDVFPNLKRVQLCTANYDWSGSKASRIGEMFEQFRCPIKSCKDELNVLCL